MKKPIDDMRVITSADILLDHVREVERLEAGIARLEAALQRLIDTDDAYATIHAPDGDDVARMIEYADAFDNARLVMQSRSAIRAFKTPISGEAA